MFAKILKTINNLLLDTITKDKITIEKQKKFIEEQFMKIKNKVTTIANKVIQKRIMNLDKIKENYNFLLGNIV
jgi:hypothetical protein